MKDETTVCATVKLASRQWKKCVNILIVRLKKANHNCSPNASVSPANCLYLSKYSLPLAVIE